MRKNTFGVGDRVRVKDGDLAGKIGKVIRVTQPRTALSDWIIEVEIPTKSVRENVLPLIWLLVPPQDLERC